MSDRDREILDKYFRNALTEESDKVYFNARMNDADFKQVLEEESAIISGLETYDSSIMKQRLQKMETKISTKARLQKIVLAVLALILTALVAWQILTKSKNESQQERLYAEYYSTYPNIIDPLTKGAGDESSIFQMYERGDFQTVIESLEGRENLSNSETFYLAMSHLELGNYSSANAHLEDVKEGQFVDDAIWYKGLICLRLQGGNQCMPQLNEIANDQENAYQQRANDLLEDLR